MNGVEFALCIYLVSILKERKIRVCTLLVRIMKGHFKRIKGVEFARMYKRGIYLHIYVYTYISCNYNKGALCIIHYNKTCNKRGI